MHTIKTILQPTDFSERSKAAFDWACSLARDSKARLILLHVMPVSVAPVMGGPPPNPMVSIESQPAWTGRFQWPASPDVSIEIEHRVAEGDSDAEILRLAGSLPADLIVIGTHGRTGLDRLLMGSVAEQVIRRSNCPVLVVK